MKIRKRFVSALIICSLFVSIPFTASAKNIKKEPFDYVALGDSLAAGRTPFGVDADGYVDYLAGRFEQSQYNVELDNYGVSGYRTTNIMGELLNPASPKNKSLRESIQNAELVTIDIGANDLLARLGEIQKNPAMAQPVLETIGKNLFTILSEIDKINPETKVYVMGYYNPFPHLPEEQQAALIPLLDAFNQTIQSVANMNGDIFVPTAKVIEKNEMEYIPNPLDIHLDIEGYKVVAKEFWKAIQESK
ncbi:GDSL-type esterase/lipase family protein [Neobacillus sp. 179-C4.2 HS]|uniref:GDSL-type esterase/lipase family protein n=1 Tax=Neobacillus driksii TaxID=3035913 RepID=A0ABV4YRD1_9BACI|nr:GDSL-type esterase/lipase family protein [Neobacillus sp. 179.-C4.2 HS]MDP5194988.1 GDSL-type esterase/lipase family protein [Neobacillus sp. 179.-C4.2 HS]